MLFLSRKSKEYYNRAKAYVDKYYERPNLAYDNRRDYEPIKQTYTDKIPK